VLVQKKQPLLGCFCVENDRFDHPQRHAGLKIQTQTQRITTVSSFVLIPFKKILQ
jgi:hypothetical protein